MLSPSASLLSALSSSGQELSVLASDKWLALLSTQTKNPATNTQSVTTRASTCLLVSCTGLRRVEEEQPDNGYILFICAYSSLFPCCRPLHKDGDSSSRGSMVFIHRVA